MGWMWDHLSFLLALLSLSKARMLAVHPSSRHPLGAAVEAIASLPTPTNFAGTSSVCGVPVRALPCESCSHLGARARGVPAEPCSGSPYSQGWLPFASPRVDLDDVARHVDRADDRCFLCISRCRARHTSPLRPSS
jgi:hypothetical protein